MATSALVASLEQTALTNVSLLPEAFKHLPDNDLDDLLFKSISEHLFTHITLEKTRRTKNKNEKKGQELLHASAEKIGIMERQVRDNLAKTVSEQSSQRQTIAEQQQKIGMLNANSAQLLNNVGQMQQKSAIQQQEYKKVEEGVDQAVRQTYQQAYQIAEVDDQMSRLDADAAALKKVSDAQSSYFGIPQFYYKVKDCLHNTAAKVCYVTTISLVGIMAISYTPDNLQQPYAALVGGIGGFVLSFSSLSIYSCCKKKCENSSSIE